MTQRLKELKTSLVNLNKMLDEAEQEQRLRNDSSLDFTITTIKRNILRIENKLKGVKRWCKRLLK